MSDVRSRISTHVNIWDREIGGVDLGNIRGGGYLTFRIYWVGFAPKRPFLPQNRHFWANVGFVSSFGAMLVVTRAALTLEPPPLYSIMYFISVKVKRSFRK